MTTKQRKFHCTNCKLTWVPSPEKPVLIYSDGTVLCVPCDKRLKGYTSDVAAGALTRTGPVTLKKLYTEKSQ